MNGTSVNGLGPARRFAVPLHLLTSRGHRATPGCPNLWTADTEPHLKTGADLKGRDRNGDTPLMWAARKNENPEVITLLLNAGAEAKAKDNEGKTAFDCAQANEKLKGTDAYLQLQEASQ